jgi:hypothetical protein
MIDATDRHVCTLARRLNNAKTDATRARLEKLAKPFQPYVNALRPNLAHFDKLYCYARADEEAVNATLIRD